MTSPDDLGAVKWLYTQDDLLDWPDDASGYEYDGNEAVVLASAHDSAIAPRDAEIARLREEVERLREERDAARGRANKADREQALAEQRAEAAESKLRARIKVMAALSQKHDRLILSERRPELPPRRER